MPYFNKLEMTIDRGIIILGKYTFPKIPWLLRKVSEVAVSVSLK